MITIAARVAAARIGLTVVLFGGSAAVAHRHAANRTHNAEEIAKAASVKANSALLAAAGTSLPTFFPRAVADLQSLHGGTFPSAAMKLLRSQGLPSRAAVCVVDVAFLRWVEGWFSSATSTVFHGGSPFFQTLVATPFVVGVRILSTPLEILKTKSVTSDLPVSQILSDMRGLCRREGVKSLFAGSGWNAVSGIGFLPWWTAYIVMDKTLPKGDSREIWHHFALGAVPSVVTDVFMNPIRIFKVHALVGGKCNFESIYRAVSRHGPHWPLLGLGGRLVPGVIQSTLFVGLMNYFSNK